MKNEQTACMVKNATFAFVAMPNAGKGTVTKELMRNFPISSLEMGSICRNEVAKNSDRGQEIATYMAKGQLAPDHIVTPLAIDALLNASAPMLCDGFPRNLAQAEAMLEAGIKPIVIEITISEEEAIRRASNRLFCPKCKRNYTKDAFSPSKVPGICDDDGATLMQRPDDANPEVARSRQDVYREQTYPVLNFFREHGIKVYTLDGSDATTVYEQAAQIIKSLI